MSMDPERISFHPGFVMQEVRRVVFTVVDVWMEICSGDNNFRVSMLLGCCLVS